MFFNRKRIQELERKLEELSIQVGQLERDITVPSALEFIDSAGNHQMATNVFGRSCYVNLKVKDVLKMLFDRMGLELRVTKQQAFLDEKRTAYSTDATEKK